MTREQNPAPDTSKARRDRRRRDGGGIGETSSTKPLTFATSDRGQHPFPQHCPHWCDRKTHLDFAGESAGCYTAAEITAHYRHGGDTFLAEIRNRVSREIMRDGGGYWTMTAKQHLGEPWLDSSDHATPPLVELIIGDPGLGEQHQAVIGMTTGEARVLAAHLVALCDRVDLP